MIKRLVTLTVLAVATALLLAAACSSEKEETSTTDISQDQQDSKIQLKMTGAEDSIFLPVVAGTIRQEVQYQPTDIVWDYGREPVTVAGMQFVPPIQFVQGPASGQRAATFFYPPIEPERDSAMLAVFYFGPDQGGSVEDNMERWIRQMHYDDGRDPHSAAIRYDLQVDGMTAHVLSMFGTYKQQTGGAMSGETAFKDRYRLVGVVFEAPEGNVFFKLTGPDETARVMIEPFMHMVKTAKKASGK
jgi:hypothetical protein